MKRIYTKPVIERIQIDAAGMIASSVIVDGTTDGEARSREFEGSSAITDDTEEATGSWF